MKKAQFQFALPVSILREGDSFIAYTPALDLSTVGDTLEQAQKRFEENRVADPGYQDQQHHNQIPSFRDRF